MGVEFAARPTRRRPSWHSSSVLRRPGLAGVEPADDGLHALGGGLVGEGVSFGHGRMYRRLRTHRHGRAGAAPGATARAPRWPSTPRSLLGSTEARSRARGSAADRGRRARRAGAEVTARGWAPALRDSALRPKAGSRRSPSAMASERPRAACAGAGERGGGRRGAAGARDRRASAGAVDGRPRSERRAGSPWRPNKAAGGCSRSGTAASAVRRRRAGDGGDVVEQRAVGVVPDRRDHRHPQQCDRAAQRLVADR